MKKIAFEKKKTKCYDVGKEQKRRGIYTYHETKAQAKRVAILADTVDEAHAFLTDDRADLLLSST